MNVSSPFWTTLWLLHYPVALSSQGRYTLCAKIYNYACLNFATVSSLLASLICGIMRSNEQLFPFYLLLTITNVRHFKHTSLCSVFSKLKKLFQYICIMLVRRIFSFCLGRSHPSKGCAVVTSLWVKTKSGCFCDGSVVTEEDIWLAAEPSSRAVAFSSKGFVPCICSADLNRLTSCYLSSQYLIF